MTAFSDPAVERTRLSCFDLAAEAVSARKGTGVAGDPRSNTATARQSRRPKTSRPERRRPLRKALSHGWKWALLIFAFLAINALRPARASQATDAFDQANKLYEEGKYQAAAGAYDHLVQTRQISPALYFNLGNAYFKSGQPGRAIVCYLLAERLAPRDPDVRANLRFARKSVGDSRIQAPWKRWLSILTLNELTVATALLLWGWFLVLATGEIWRDWRPALRSSRLLLGACLALAATWLGWAVHDRLGRPAAVVTVSEAVIRYGPFDESQSFYTLHDGAELSVLGTKDGWLQVADASHRTGWLRGKEVTVLSPSLPLPGDKALGAIRSAL